MPFKETFSEFYSKVKLSLEDGTFAKLTLAKTIGNTDLMNIYVRPILDENTLKLELKFKFQREELFEIHTIDSAFSRLLEFINNPFLSAILFSTEFDLTYKLNKKRAVSVIEQFPSFTHASPVILEYLERKS
ncbi:hypothetical protein [Flavobacterium macrobrachii]|jgi:hypothetical protein|uniref:Immunity protein 50 n=1 Tax=Flavobacterium macrobrachii TaxID=591204 RepID=A0ABS2CYD8_9FLAO|nr:hypothetical protein [Flavobacterium macrobrachii]MBM6499987.1 hypothetical protein [Flavobacterium macrobrachii]PZO29304.1 MAG: hypothetical protein DCF13_06685 [Flavobacteriaceae bacterium]